MKKESNDSLKKNEQSTEEGNHGENEGQKSSEHRSKK